MSESVFEKGLMLDVTKHIEKKGNFNYLSWPFAVQELKKLDPKATWEVRHFVDYTTKDEIWFENTTNPFMETDCGYFVEVVVIMGDGTKSQQVHPVLDNRNQPIKQPNAFQINTSIQRCLVKAIALASGIGLHIYAGEDLPPSDDKEETSTGTKQSAENWIEEIKTAGTLERLKEIYEEAYSATDGKDRAEVTREKDKRKQQLQEPNPNEDQNN